MSVPKYYEFMLPILKIASDKKEHDLTEVREMLSKEFKLTEDDLKFIQEGIELSKFIQ